MGKNKILKTKKDQEIFFKEINNPSKPTDELVNAMRNRNEGLVIENGIVTEPETYFNTLDVAKNIKSIDILLKLIDNTDIVSDHIKNQSKVAKAALADITTEVKKFIL